jgi:hypothetical protein
VENNLFEHCDGDPEIISVKTNDNIVRYNTFTACQGTVCLRQTNRSVVEGNYFFGKGKAGTGGLRVYGKAHLIYNNYFEGLTGDKWDAAITLTNGDVDTNTTSFSSHVRPVRNTIAYNTLVNNYSNIEIGFTNNGNYGKPPKDNVFAGNIVVGKSNELIKYLTVPVNHQWIKNIMNPITPATLGITAAQPEIWVVDPQMALTDSVWKLSSSSPAVNYAPPWYPYVSVDIDGQTRDANPDAGCDEYSTLPRLRKPLTAQDVGPDSPEQLTDIHNRASDGCTLPNELALLQNYPNPFNPVTAIQYLLPSPSHMSLVVYDILGRTVATLVDGEEMQGLHTVRFDARSLPSGTYYYELRYNAQREVKKMIVLR